MKRKKFLESFLGAIGSQKIHWSHIDYNKIIGTIIYDLNDSEEKQDFIWHMTEENVPSESVRKTIDFLKNNELINLDRINTSLSSLDLDFIDISERKYLENELLNVEVKMLDDGVETDSYYFHY